MKTTFLIALILALIPSVASAQEVAELTKDITLVEILKKGGWVMGALVVLSIFTAILILLYFLTLRRSSVVSNRFMNASEAMIRKRDYLGLVGYCHGRREAVARVTQKTLDFLTKNPNASHPEIREVAEAEGNRQAGILTQRISYLADIGGIAPMVGLLGTVIGMIKSFMEIANGNIEGAKQLELAQGVWEALGQVPVPDSHELALDGARGAVHGVGHARNELQDERLLLQALAGAPRQARPLTWQKMAHHLQAPS